MLSALFALLGVVGCGGIGAGDQARIPDPLADVPARDLFARGRVLVVHGDSIRAEQYLTAAMDRGYPEQEAMPLLIRACVSSSRLSSALGYAEPYLRRHPRDWSLRFLVATLQQGLGRTERARANLEQVIVDAPEAPEPEFVLAMLLRDDLSLDDEARPLLERYLELAPRGRHAAEVRAALAPSLVRVHAPVEIRRDHPSDGDTPSESPIPSIAPAADSGVQP
ncbi:MAG: hypothetical protein GXP55_00960 [Deltaproteobacteria bacterium]|nr:hypothetical protein [Deltaproteobacteria bacterium]